MEFFFRPPPERTGFAGGRKNPNDLSQTPGFHASFGSVVWGGGKFGGGRRLAPTAGPQWHRRSRFARHAREPTEKKKAKKRCGSPFNIYCLKTKGHWIFEAIWHWIFITMGLQMNHKYILSNSVALDFVLVVINLFLLDFFYPKNHGISKLVVWRSQNPP